MISRAKIRIFDPFFSNVYTQDVSNETLSVDYSFDANGCAAATINTNLLWEQVYARGYYQGRNGVEISTADDTLQVPINPYAGTIYVNGPASGWQATAAVACVAGTSATLTFGVGGTSSNGNASSANFVVSDGTTTYVNANLNNSSGSQSFTFTPNKNSISIYFQASSFLFSSGQFYIYNVSLMQGSTTTYVLGGIANLFTVTANPNATVIQITEGVSKLYVGATAPYDATKTLAAAQIDIDDGANPTYRIPVTGVGSDSGGPYITVGSPIAGTGNNTSIPAYGVGATIFRRVYAGRIARRTRVNDRSQKMTYSCVGVSKRLAEVQINATFNSIDLGQAAGAVISNAANRLTDLVLTNTYPTIGTVYSGQVTNTDIFSFITSNLLATVASGDIWVLRVGHDRAPLITRLYTSGTNTYTFNVVLPQRAVKFRPLEVETDDEDISNMANSVLVVGDTDPVTKQPIQNVYQDSTSIPVYLQIDGASVSNVGVKDTATAANFGRGVLNSRSFPQAASSFKLFVRNDNTALAAPASPTGLANGDVVYGYENIVISGFDSTDISPNKCPDSGLSLITLTGTSATWSLYNGIVGNLGTTNYFSATTASGNSGTNTFASSSQLLVGPGQTYTISGVIDATAVTSAPNGAPAWSVWVANPRTGQFQYSLALASGTIGAKTTPSATFTIPAGVYNIIVLCENLGAVGTTLFSQPNLNLGSNVLPYVTNNAAPSIYGLASSVSNHIDGGMDRVQTISFQPVEPDINASIAERVNAVVAQINAAKSTPFAIDQYCVSVDIQPPSYTYSSTSLVVAFPTYLALFAKGTNIITIPAANVTLPASSNAVYVFVTPSGTYVTQANNSAAVAGAILIGYFTTNATGVIGSTFRAAVGVIKIGVGNINVASTLPAPIVTAYTANNGNSLNGMAADLVIAAALSNVPNSATGVQWYYRQAVSVGGNGTWVPYGVSNLSIAAGSSYPSVSQTVTLEFADLTNGTSYDFAVAYESLAGFGALMTVVSSVAAQTIAIKTTYMVGGVPVTPTQVNGAAVTTLSANGANASAFVQFQATNQPTNGSLSRINFWIRPSALGGSNAIGMSNFNWAPYGGLPASGVNSTSPPSNAVYSFSPADLMNSTAYDFGFSYEDAQGYESVICVVVSSFTAAVLNLSASANSPIPSAIASAGPYITSSSLGTQVSQGAGVAGQPFVFSIGDWTAGNNPGWFAGFLFYWRVHGDTTTAPHQIGQIGVITQVSNIPYSIPLGAGGTYDIGIAYEGANSTISTIVWPTGLQNATVAAINPPMSIAGTGNINLVPDGQLAHVVSASNEAYWSEYGIDGNLFGVNLSPDVNAPYTCFFWKNGAGSNRYANSPGFQLNAGVAYNLSMYSDLINATGTMTLNLIAVSGTVSNVNPSNGASATASVSQTSGKAGFVNAAFTPTVTGTYCVQISNSGVSIGSTRIYAGAFQVMQGSTFTGFVPSTPVTQSGTTSHQAASTQVQSTIATTSDAGGSYLQPSTVSGQQMRGGTAGDTGAIMNGLTLLQPRHDPVVLLSSTGSQINQVPDSDVRFGVGGSATGSYWGPLTAPFALNQSTSGNANTFRYTVPSGGASSVNQLLSSPAGYVSVSAGSVWSLSAVINTATLLDGSVSLIVLDSSSGLEQGRITQPFGVQANATGSRLSGTITISSGTTSVSFLMQVTCSSANAGVAVALSRLQFEIGTTATSYKSNATNSQASQFEHGAMSVATKSTITSSFGSEGSYLASGVVYNRHITGATQDGLADGSTFARVKSTELSSNAVARVNDGTNIRTAAQLGAVVATAADGAGSFLQPITVAGRHLIGGANNDIGAILDGNSGTSRLLFARHAPSTQLVSTGSQVNHVADSDIKFTPGPNAYWATLPANFGNSTYFAGREAFDYLTPSGGASAVNYFMQNSAAYINVSAGQTYTLSALCDTAQFATGAGNMALIVSAVGGVEQGRLTVLPGINQTAGVRQSVSITIASGVSQVQLVWQQNWASSAAGAAAFIGQIQFEVGSVATAYKANDSQHGGSSLVHGAMSSGVQATLNASGSATKSSFLNTQGSIAPYTTDFQIICTSPSGATYVKYYICGAGGSGSAVTFYRADGTQLSVAAVGTSASPIQVNVSASGNNVYFIVYVASGASTFTVTPYTPTAPTPAQVALAIGDGTLATIATASTYVTSGGGGGVAGGGCPELSQRLQMRVRGVEKYGEARELRPGDFVMGSDGRWKELHKANAMAGEIWKVRFDTETIAVDASHLFMDPKGNWINVKELKSGKKLLSHGRERITTQSVERVGMGAFMALSIDHPFAYTIGRTISHNVKVK